MNKYIGALAALSILLLGGCTTPIYRASVPTVWYPSPNFNERRPNFVIIHHTGDNTTKQSLQTLTDPRQEVSAHYLISQDGVIYQLVDERFRAWHAGNSRWGTANDLNSTSLGIEIQNNGNEPFTEAAISALMTLLSDIRDRYHIPKENFLGHADIAPRRKSDPSHYFPWQRLAKAGFGMWCDQLPTILPVTFNSTLALATLGYDTADIDAAVRAFKLHYVPSNTEVTLSATEQHFLYCLAEQSLNNKN